ncbi:hypothetical protein H632_c3972p0 [Helicosporidium sp. ATCC 50920]|nr:hypothetical protein H632_c3972p0 [Helicosporidium sp. ATCC 50920]|eukprot:KDD72033.1 hypothetical protein H632_c3972p0 [Helicosporidium sp. ATCC 50920]
MRGPSSLDSEENAPSSLDASGALLDLHLGMQTLPCASPAAFLERASFYPLLCALVRRQQALWLTRPGAEVAREAVGETLCAMYTYVLRGGFQAEELTVDLLLTLLWMVDAWSSQHASKPGACLATYLALHPEPMPLWLRFRASMPACQMVVLKRCRWQVNPHDSGLLALSAARLRSCRHYHALSHFVLAEVQRRWLLSQSAKAALQCSEEARGSCGECAAVC